MVIIHLAAVVDSLQNWKYYFQNQFLYCIEHCYFLFLTRFIQQLSEFWRSKYRKDTNIGLLQVRLLTGTTCWVFWPAFRCSTLKLVNSQIHLFQLIFLIILLIFSFSIFLNFFTQKQAFFCCSTFVMRKRNRKGKIGYSPLWVNPL